MMVLSAQMSAWFANCKGSMQSCTIGRRCCRTILSKVFITCDISTMGLKLGRLPGCPFSGTGTIQKAFQIFCKFFFLQQLVKEMPEHSHQLLSTHLEDPRIDFIGYSGLADPGSGELSSHSTGCDD
ncbi:hypothetical protein ILYODFUR_033281 [Ilyodon furcidens]|uniref:Uncharacterized protein n=1 Tax=Ilyodon furcidens TaxID=33524 RepID=A0ABV0TDD4_9TELE